MTSSSEWRRIDAALDEILSLPPDERSEACARIAGHDETLRLELESLLAKVDGNDPVLDFPAALWPAGAQPASAGLPAGTRIGAFRIIQLLGRGGMGEVYRAERADGHFERQVAIKLMRPEVVDRTQRFHAERQILARLEHPNIAGLHDGGVAEDGRLFMVMDLIEGQPITHWCREHRCSLTRRLQLFLAICDAVAYAHRKLIVHRDLKPSNVFVTEEGEVKLLDFGVARLLDQTPRDETRHGAMSPGYAAPEQLTGGQISTATDVYALGVLLFELVTGTNPWGRDELPLAALVSRVLEENVPLASKFAERQADAPVPARFISGDLDAIIAKAMRTEPESRYGSVAQMQADVIRTLRSEPVSAREGARWYVAGRFLKRHRWGVAATAVLALAVLSAAGGIAWQGHIAKQEAARASAVKNFLMKVFRASDPRVASDKPRGQITAKELLDGSVGRIDQEFAGQPELRLELLGMTMEIYGYLGDDERYEALMKRRVSIARDLYGEHHPIVIEGVITDAWASIYTQNFAEAKRQLERSDALLHEAGLDESKLRAEWWLAKERALHATPGSAAGRRDALNRGIALFAKYDPANPSYPAALANAATTRYLDAEYLESADLNDRAIKVEEKLADRDDTDLAVIYSNYGDVLSKLGRIGDAERAYDRSVNLSLKTEGEHYGTYWRTLESHASMLFLHGERDRAMMMFETMLAAIPADWKANTDDTLARETYAEILTRDGRAAQAVPILETALRVLTVRPRHDYDLRHAHLLLGDAYDGAGRIDEARQALQWALHDYESSEPHSRPSVVESRERWARFLLDHPRTLADASAARTELNRVLVDAIAAAPYTTALAEAHADLARMALNDGHAAAALSELSAAETALSRVKSVYDVRIADDLLLQKSEVLTALRRLPEARAAAALALQSAQRHDSAQSPRVSRASAQLAKLAGSVAS
jgi:serine/threonine protein kinase/tetratricopeptide (TPR) repeat protein